jgi:hypothetical protein
LITTPFLMIDEQPGLFGRRFYSEKFKYFRWVRNHTEHGAQLFASFPSPFFLGDFQCNLTLSS